MNILVKRDGALGDVIEATPIIARLRCENPDATIDVETFYAGVFKDNPYVSNLKKASEHYDRVIDLNMAFEKAMRKLHPIDAYSEVAFGDWNTPHRLEFAYSPPSGTCWIVDDPRQEFRPQINKTAVIHPARSWPIRTLPLEWWQELVDLLRQCSFRVVVTGTAQDHDGLRGVDDARGRYSLAEQAQLIAEADCFICSESGPMILAQTTMTPIIALLTMVPPEHVMHERNGERGWGFHAIQANMPCVGCAAHQPAETVYFDCRYGHRDCVRAFDAHEIAQLAVRIAQC